MAEELLAYVSVAILALLLYYYSPDIVARYFSLKRGETAPASNEELERALRSGMPLLIYFSNLDVKACQLMEPHVEQVAKHGGFRVLRIDASKPSKVLEDYKIRSVPTSVFVKDGVVKDVVVGVMKKEKLERKLEEIRGGAKN